MRTQKLTWDLDDPNNAAAAQVGLKDFDALVDNAAKETSDLNVRYERYAEAQAWLEDSSPSCHLWLTRVQLQW